MPNDNGVKHLKYIDKEFIKEFTIYDVSNRPTSIYKAYTDAPDAAPCYLIQYAYDGVSNRVEKSKESESVWDVSYDI